MLRATEPDFPAAAFDRGAIPAKGSDRADSKRRQAVPALPLAAEPAAGTEQRRAAGHPAREATAESESATTGLEEARARPLRPALGQHHPNFGHCHERQRAASAVSSKKYSRSVRWREAQRFVVMRRSASQTKSWRLFGTLRGHSGSKRTRDILQLTLLRESLG